MDSGPALPPAIAGHSTSRNDKRRIISEGAVSRSRFIMPCRGRIKPDDVSTLLATVLSSRDMLASQGRDDGTYPVFADTT